MGDLFIKIIEEVGVDSCVQIIMDNALVCKAAGMIVETKYPQLFSFWTPFIANLLIVWTLNLSQNLSRGKIMLIIWVVSVVDSFILVFLLLQIFWTPYFVHSLNLALKYIALDVTWIGNIIENARHIRNFVQNHTNALTILNHSQNASLIINFSLVNR